MKPTEGKAIYDNCLIGIDPDVQASGFAIYDKKAKRLTELKTLDLTDLFDELKAYNANYHISVNLEAGFLSTATWHKGGTGAAQNVGRNSEIGRQIEKFLKKNNIDYKLIKPAGYSSYDHKKFCMYTGWDIKNRTNPETRVAGLLVFGY